MTDRPFATNDAGDPLAAPGPEGDNVALGSEVGRGPQRESSDATGLTPPWVAAADVLELASPGAFERIKVLAEPGVDQNSLFHRWLAAMWTDAESGLARHVEDPALRAACDTAIALHIDAGAGRAIGRAAWRKERSQLSRGVSETLQGRAIAVVAAACWAPEAVPDVFADVFKEWSSEGRSLLMAEVDAVQGWDGVAMARQDDEMLRAVAAAEGYVLGEMAPGWQATVDGKITHDRVQAALTAFTGDPPENYQVRQKAVRAARKILADLLVRRALELVG